MKYFDYEDESLFMEKQHEYQSRFSKIASRFPKRFLDEYYQSAFHDFAILSYSSRLETLKCNQGNRIFELNLAGHGKLFTLRFDGVTGIRTDLGGYVRLGLGSYQYAEINEMSDGLMEYDVSVFLNKDAAGRITVLFKKLSASCIEMKSIWGNVIYHEP